MQVTYYGHSSFMVEVGTHKLLFDPFITPNPLAASIDVSVLRPDYILLSHGHQDHVADAAVIQQQSGATIISNFEIATWYNKQGITLTHPMNHGGQYTFPFGTVKYVNAVHSSSMPDGSYGGQPGGFIVTTEEGAFYYAGDTALTMDMQLFGRRDLSFSFLPIGDNFTMGIDDAVTAAGMLKCKRIIGMHYDTFPPITIDHDEARRRFRNAEVELILLPVGEPKTL